MGTGSQPLCCREGSPRSWHSGRGGTEALPCAVPAPGRTGCPGVGFPALLGQQSLQGRAWLSLLSGAALAARICSCSACSTGQGVLTLLTHPSALLRGKKKTKNFSPCICCSLAVLEDFYPDLHLDGTVAARRVGLDFLEGKVELGAGVAVPPSPARVPQDPPSCSMNSLELAQRSCQDPLLLSLPHSLAPSPSSGPNLLGFPGKGALPWDVWRT